MNSNNQSFFIEEISQYDIIDESYSIMYKDMQNWHNLQLAIYECVLNEGNIINFIKDIIHKIIETLKKWWKNITDFIKKVINNIKSFFIKAKKEMDEKKKENNDGIGEQQYLKISEGLKSYLDGTNKLYNVPDYVSQLISDQKEILDDTLKKIGYISDYDNNNYEEIPKAILRRDYIFTNLKDYFGLDKLSIEKEELMGIFLSNDEVIIKRKEANDLARDFMETRSKKIEDSIVKLSNTSISDYYNKIKKSMLELKNKFDSHDNDVSTMKYNHISELIKKSAGAVGLTNSKITNITSIALEAITILNNKIRSDIY